MRQKLSLVAILVALVPLGLAGCSLTPIQIPLSDHGLQAGGDLPPGKRLDVGGWGLDCATCQGPPGGDGGPGDRGSGDRGLGDRGPGDVQGDRITGESLPAGDGVREVGPTADGTKKADKSPKKDQP